MKMNKTLLSAAVAVGLLSTSTVTHAAGFQLAEYSATGLGRAYAGEAAMADGADAQWRNPAMLTYLEGTQVSVGAIYVDPNIDIDGTSTSMMGQSTSSNSSDFAHSAVIPNFYVSHKYNDKFALGFAAGTNYGMETDLGKDFGGANHGNEASVTTMELNLNAAYQVLESVSIGGVVLDDGNSMMEGSKLSSLETLMVRARLDTDGNVSTRDGDWYGESEVVELGAPVTININKQY